MIIKAIYKHDQVHCYLNTDYVVDVFEEQGKYIAYTLDNDRDGYEITEEDFEKWQQFANSAVQDVRLVKDHANCPYADECTSSCRSSIHVDDMGRYDPYTDSFVRGDKAE